jgi:hypothetical protein
MWKKITAGALAGWIVMIAWIFLSNGMLGIKSRIDMKRLVNEEWVYEVLKESITEPGGYSINPRMESPTGPFPEGEPVFSVHYSGLGHGAAGRIFIANLGLALAAQLIAAWMLSSAGRKMISSYSGRVLFYVAIGALFALFGDLMRYGIGSYSMHHALILAAQSLAGWLLCGLAVAAVVRQS